MGRKRKLRVTKGVSKTAADDEKHIGLQISNNSPPPNIKGNLSILSRPILSRPNALTVSAELEGAGSFGDFSSPTQPLDLTITYDYSCEQGSTTAPPVKAMEEMSKVFTFKVHCIFIVW